MSAGLMTRIDPTKLYPAFRERLVELLDEAVASGVSYWCISGYRTYAEQSLLYARGRTASGLIITNAEGGESAHNFGIAVDVCVDRDVGRPGLQADYSPESYLPLAELAPKHGLVWGGSWKFRDLPHIQWPGYVAGEQLKQLRDVYEASGLVSVFQFLDISQGAS